MGQLPSGIVTCAWKDRLPVNVQRRGQNRTREIRPSGIVGGPSETWPRVELGTLPATERAGVVTLHITLVCEADISKSEIVPKNHKGLWLSTRQHGREKSFDFVC